MLIRELGSVAWPLIADLCEGTALLAYHAVTRVSLRQIRALEYGHKVIVLSTAFLFLIDYLLAFNFVYSFMDYSYRRKTHCSGFIVVELWLTF